MWLKWVIISFLLCGISDTTWKMAGEMGKESVNAYLLFFHFFALLSAVIVFFLQRKKITKTEFILGTTAGATLIAGGICSMNAILVLPGIVFFPVASCGNLLTVTILANIFWKEKPAKRQIYGLIVSCIAIILIALG